MRKFIVQILLFFGLVAGSMVIILLQADGYTDAFYLRFTTPPQKAMILGTSKAAQGIRPDVLNEIMPEYHFFNYAFTIGTSPYGPTYFNSITQKLDPDTKNAVFLLHVDSWSISSNSEDHDDISQFSETQYFLGKIKNVNRKPNLYYLTHCYNYPYYQIITNKITYSLRSAGRLHTNGWLEVSKEYQEKVALEKKKNMVATYQKEYLPYYKPSESRKEWLIKTIDFLQQHGTVFLVTLPVSKEFWEIDSLLYPDFREAMAQLANEKNILYIDLIDMRDSFLYIDGIHLYQESGRAATQIIGEQIETWIKR